MIKKAPQSWTIDISGMNIGGRMGGVRQLIAPCPIALPDGTEVGRNHNTGVNPVLHLFNLYDTNNKLWGYVPRHSQ